MRQNSGAAPLTRWCASAALLFGTLGFAVSAGATIIPTGSVNQFGGDPADDGPVGFTTGDLVLGADTRVAVMENSRLDVLLGSNLTAGSLELRAATPGFAEANLSGAGTTVDLIGANNRFDLTTSGIIRITDGAVVDATDRAICTADLCNNFIGNLSGSNAELLVSGAGSRLSTINAFVVAGANTNFGPPEDSTGQLTLVDGGQINSEHVTLSGAPSGPNAANVRTSARADIQGPGSTWNAITFIVANGSGTSADLVLQDDATLNASGNLIIGTGSPSSGRAEVRSGSQVTIGGESGFPSLGVGMNGATGSLLVDAGNVDIGVGTGGFARILLGAGGTGDMLVRNGGVVTLIDAVPGSVNDDGIFVGRSAGTQAGTGSLTVDGSGSTLTVRSSTTAFLDVGTSQTNFSGTAAATGAMDILNGANVLVDGTAGLGFLGAARGADTAGTINVSGVGTTLDVTGTTAGLYISGNYGGATGGGAGLMNITDGAAVRVTTSSAAADALLLVGLGAGAGALNVNTGGTVTVDGTLAISVPNAGESSQTGRVVIDGTGRVAVAARTIIGSGGFLGGTGTLITDTLELYAGGVLDAVDIVLEGVREAILQPGATFAHDDEFIVGDGVAVVTMLEGSSVTTTGFAGIGSAAGTTGSMNLSGVETYFGIDGGELAVGTNGGTGTLIAQSGALVFVSGGEGGAVLRIGSDGLVQVSDTDTAITVDGLLAVEGGMLDLQDGGAAGADTTRISAGGLISAPITIVSSGELTPAVGGGVRSSAAFVEGAGSTWGTTQLRIATGSSDSGEVHVTDGGLFDVASHAVVGEGSGNVGLLTVADPDSTFRIRSNTDLPALAIGVAGATGNVALNGGHLNVESVAGGNGLVLVGNDGVGSLFVTNGATMTLADTASSPSANSGLFIGLTPQGGTADGTVRVAGPGSSLLVDQHGRPATIQVGFSDFPVAEPGTAVGRFEILNGGHVTVDGNAGLGFVGISRGANTEGTLNVIAPGATLDITGAEARLAIANNLVNLLADEGGLGTMVVGNGGTVNVTPTTPGAGSLLVGAGVGSALLAVLNGGRVNVDGELVLAEQEEPGVAPSGTLFIDTDGFVTVTGATRILPGGILTGNGTLTSDTVELFAGGVMDNSPELLGVREFIMHPGATLSVTDGAELGGDVASVRLLSGATLDVTGDTFVGNAPTETAALTLDGGLFRVSEGDFQIGVSGGTGTLIASGGAQVSANGSSGGNFHIGSGGLVQVTGSGSSIGASALLSVDGGELRLLDGGRANAGSALVTDGGLLTGTGTLLVNDGLRVTDGGVLTAGQSPGRLDIVGDVQIDAGSLLFEIAGTDAGQYDVIAVDGNLEFLGGSFDLQLLDGFVPAQSDEFRLLEATGSLTVDPALVNFGYVGTGPDYSFEVRDVLDANGGTFRGGFVSFLAVDIAELEGLTGNQETMATGLDDLCPRVEGLDDPTSDEADLDALCGGLRNVENSEEEVLAGLDGLAPEEITGTVESLLRYTTLQHGNLSQRINGLRYGGKQIDVSGLNLQFDDNFIAGADLQRVLENLVGGAASADEDFARWGFFGNGAFSFGDKSPTANESGFDFDGALITLGADYRVRDNLFLGGAFGYNDLNADFETGGGLDFQAMTASVFGTWVYEESGYLDVLATYGTSETDTRRRIHYEDANGLVDRVASADADGDQFIASVGGGWDFESAGFILGPHAGANFTEVSVDGFEETGAAGANLALPEQVARSLTANLGFHGSYTFLPNFGVLVPYARVDYVREFKDDAETINIRFVNDRFADDPLDPTGPIAVRTDAPDSDYLVWSLGASAQFVHGIAAFVNYRGTSLMDDVSLGELTFGLRLEQSF